MAFTLTPESLTRPGANDDGLPADLNAVTALPEGKPRWIVVTVAMAALAGSCALLTWLVKDPGFTPGTGNATVDGMTIFAVFFVAALAIERLLEPLSGWLMPTDEAKQKATESEGNARVAIAAVKRQPESSNDVGHARRMLQQTAQDKADLAERKWRRSVVMWTIASIVGMIAAAVLKLYFLGTVGIAEAARWQEILATGLIIGAGTKPLHDLTELITAKKQAAESQQ